MSRISTCNDSVKILVTGGAGFIGSHLVSQLQESGHEVVVLDDLSSGSRENLPGFTGEIVEGSILDPSCLQAVMEGVDLVYHLAAYTSAAGSIEEPLKCAKLNVEGLLMVMTAADAAGCRRMVYASSAAVYGNNPITPKVEDLEPCPESPYALTKLDGERYLRMLGGRWGMETTAVRFFNVFGPRQNLDSGYAAAIPNFCDRAFRGKDLQVFGDGEQTRDFIYVDDLVSALSHLGEGSHAGVFNVGTGEIISINALADQIVESSGSPSRITHLDERPGDVRHSRADLARLEATGWKPEVGFRKGLARTVEFYRAQAGVSES